MAKQSWWASQNLSPQVVGTPKHTPQSPLCPTSAQSIVSEGRKLGVRGGTLGSREVVGTPKIGPTGGRDPKTYSLISITPYLNLAPLAPSHPLSLPGPLRASWGLRKPWEPLEAFGSLGSSVRLRGLAFLAPPHLPLLPLAPSHPLSLPGFPWAPGTFLGSQKALGAFTNLQQPFTALGLQSDSGALLPLLPSPPSLPLTPSCPLSLPGSPWTPRTFLGPQEALGAFGSLGSSVRLGGLAFLPPLTPLPFEPP